MVRVCELVTCETVSVEMKGRKDERRDFLMFFLRQSSSILMCTPLLADIQVYLDLHLLVCFCLPLGFVFVDLSSQGCVKSPLPPSLGHTAQPTVCMYVITHYELCEMHIIAVMSLCKHVVLDTWIM